MIAIGKNQIVKEETEMKQRKYFEVFASVGRKKVPSLDHPQSPEALLKDMEYARIHGAALVANSSIDYSFFYGNNEAIDLAKNSPRLVHLAAVPNTAPLESGDKDYFNTVLNQGAKGLVLPNSWTYRSPILPKSIKPMVEALEAHNLPLIITNVVEPERLATCGDIAEAYPDLPILMQGTTWGFGRAFWDVMERCPNLYYEISSIHINDILEYTKNYLGIERVLYSSSWPIKSMGALKSLIEWADLSEEEKDLVASGNAYRLLGLDPNAFSLYDDADCQFDEIAKEADAGLPISTRVIDMHSHVVGKSARSVNNCIMLNADHDHIAKKMDRLGIDTTITAPWSGINYDGILGMEETLESAKAHPGKFLGFSTANIHYQEDLDSLVKYHEEYPDIFVGVKPYPPYQQFSLLDDVCADWFTYANDHHLLMLVHADGGEYADHVDVLADKYPNITFILAHSGTSYGVARKNASVANKHDNVVLDITYTTTGRDMIEFLVKEVGADKVLYGSDLPMRDPAPQLGWVCYARISLEDKKKLLSGNIERLLKKRI